MLVHLRHKISSHFHNSHGVLIFLLLLFAVSMDGRLDGACKSGSLAQEKVFNVCTKMRHFKSYGEGALATIFFTVLFILWAYKSYMLMVIQVPMDFYTSRVASFLEREKINKIFGFYRCFVRRHPATLGILFFSLLG